jgi:hypothetical protein
MSVGSGVGVDVGVTTGSGHAGELWPMSGVAANIVVATIVKTRRLEM